MVKNPPADAKDTVQSLGGEDSPRGGNGNPLQYSCLGNPMDRGAWWPTVRGVTKVRHDLVTKPPPPSVSMLEILSKYIYSSDR